MPGGVPFAALDVGRHNDGGYDAIAYCETDGCTAVAEETVSGYCCN